MTYREAVPALVKALVTLYPREESIRAIVIQTGVPEGEVSFSSRAVDTWTSVLSKARQYNKAEAIIGTALEAYPAYAELQAAVAAYREVVARGDVPPLPLRRCDFYAHVSLPPNFVARPALLHEVRDVILATPTTALTSAIPMDALHGMGGIGKSVVARALCDDPEVQDAFADGILWATIGQTPDLIARLGEWVRKLGGIIPQTAPTINELKQNLAELLTDRACLLILDDVWHRTDAEPFLVGGPRCRLLLTTRDSEVARGLGAGVHAVPAMDPDEAVDLLELWAGGALRQAEEALKRQIVHRLGYLPLAIKLAGSQLQRRSPERWLAGFDATQLQERRVEKVHDSLARTLALSLDELGAVERRLYVALAIFREDEATPMPGICRLWAGLAGYGEDQTVDLVQDLAARALLQIVDSAADGLPATVVIHDLLRDFMAAELGEAGRLAAHEAIVEAYRRTQVGDGWATAPDDGYLYDHLGYHLDKLADHEASAVTELQSLFANDAWLQVRVSGAGYRYNGYLADLDVAWRHAHQEAIQQIEAGEEPPAFAECMRYALIRTSINSISSNYSPILVVWAIERGLWSPERAFDISLRIPDTHARARMIISILPYMPPKLLPKAVQAGLSAALSIWDEELRARALCDLMPCLSGELLVQASVALQNIECKPLDNASLLQVISSLSNDILTQGLADALIIRDEQSYAQTLAAMALYLSAENRTQSLKLRLTAALAIRDELSRAETLAVLAPHLVGKDQAEALEQGLIAARAIKHDLYRVQTMVTFLPLLAEEDRTQILEEGLECALTVEDERYCAEMLAALAPHLPQPLLDQGLATARAIKNGPDRALALASFVPHLVEDKIQVLEEGLQCALASDDERYRVTLLAALAPHLSGNFYAQALTAGLAIQHEEYRSRALANLVPTARDSESLLREIRLTMAHHLWNNLRYQNRRELLRFCSQVELFRPPIFDANTLSRIAGDMIEVCEHWTWL